MRVIGSVVAVVLCVVLVVGCQPEQQVAPPVQPPLPELQAPRISTEQEQLLEEILEYIKQTGSTGEEVLEEIRRLKQLDQAPRGVEAIDDDLRVAKALVAAAGRGAADKQAEETAAELGRLVATLRTLRAEIPAAVIAQHLERALIAISNLPAKQAVSAASSSLLAAIDTAMQAPAPLVPEVVDAVERAKGKVDDEQLPKAAEQIVEILAELRNDATVELLDTASGSVRGAQDALQRAAWPVLIAELDQLEAMLSQLQEKIGEETTVVAGEQEPTEAEETEAEPGEEAEADMPEARPQPAEE